MCALEDAAGVEEDDYKYHFILLYTSFRCNYLENLALAWAPYV